MLRYSRRGRWSLVFAFDYKRRNRLVDYCLVINLMLYSVHIMPNQIIFHMER